MERVGFHEGELEVQRRAGVERQAARLAGMLDPANLDDGAGAFLAERQLALLTARDRAGRLWTSPLAGPPGFLEGRGTSLRMATSPAAGDPLHGLPAGQAVGLLAIDLAIRRRVRVNGNLVVAETGLLEIAAEQAYGNCPKYIQERHLHPSPEGSAPGTTGLGRLAVGLEENQLSWIREADTFFLGTVHPDRGADASHRGGSPGFVRVDGDELWWPDYPGNNLFNSFGNLAIDPHSALLFLDFRTGATLHLSGTASLTWTDPGGPGDDGGTGRRVRFRVERVVTAGPLSLLATGVAPYARNPAVTD